MSFGWSAGDILAAAEFVLEVTRALDEVDGAAKDFRTASSFLKNLNSALAHSRHSLPSILDLLTRAILSVRSKQSGYPSRHS
jgi:hypothetical protein